MSRREGPREDLDACALTVAMTVAPGVYARNRMFAFFVAPAAAHARMRARLVRSVVVQMSRARGKVENLTLVEAETDRELGPRWLLGFAIPTMGFTRTVTLTQEELAALRYVLTRIGRAEGPMRSTREDEALVLEVLKKLA